MRSCGTVKHRRFQEAPAHSPVRECMARFWFWTVTSECSIANVRAATTDGLAARLRHDTGIDIGERGMRALLVSMGVAMGDHDGVRARVAVRLNDGWRLEARELFSRIKASAERSGAT